MVSVLLIWGYMSVTCYVLGFAALKVISGRQEYSVKMENSFLYAGIVVTTVYAQFFSLFYRVGLAANAAMLLLCAVCAFRYRKELAIRLHTLRLTVTPVRAGVTALLLLLFAYGTSTGIIHYDTGLYHAQSIRWIEEYGIVPGLGNLHSRLAYNSASFCQSALYSFAFLGGQSYHCGAGFLAFLLALTCIEGFTWDRMKAPRLSDFVRVMGVYYLLIIFDEMVSPASDYFMVLGVFYILIRWLDLIEKKEKSYLPYGFLCVMGVWLVTVKLSGALILLLTIKPACMMIKEKRGKEIGKFLSLGLITAIPFLIRNVILSGWLLYPFTAIDLFSFDFKIPKGVAAHDAKEIQVWGRGLYDVAKYEKPITFWFPDWFMSLSVINKAFLIMALFSLIFLIGLVLYTFLKKKKELWDFLLLEGTVAASFLFWLVSAPLIRYGCVYLWMLPVLMCGYLYLKCAAKRSRYRLYQVALLLFAIYKAFRFSQEVLQTATDEYLICQQDYDNFETIAYELNGYTFYYPVRDDRTGYDDFPSSPTIAADIFRGDSIEDGFVDVVHTAGD